MQERIARKRMDESFGATLVNLLPSVPIIILISFIIIIIIVIIISRRLEQ